MIPSGGDHPRSRGVYLTDAITELEGLGSSPLARGLRGEVSLVSSCGRIIPARAGFTLRPTARTCSTADHPRSRGVYPAPPCDYHMLCGSSPLARGLRPLTNPNRGRGGIIPARAGFTVGPIVAIPDTPDHPRSRGVYLCWTRRRSLTVGSSPLARGLLRFCSLAMASSWDHPRSRGVYAERNALVEPANGSSPLARGLLAKYDEKTDPSRIIPARAGFTRSSRTASRPATDHPRSRGVYKSSSGHGGGVRGSSPLARGLRDAANADYTLTGIIPARAGFTCHSTTTVTRTRDHPRSRGVYSSSTGKTCLTPGSSPLARGLRQCALLHR